MKLLITGATGLVGQAIVKELKKYDLPVHYLTTDRKKIISKDNYYGFHWNPSLGQMDESALEGVTAIINLAGATISNKWTSSYKKEVLNSRLDSLKTLKKGLEKAKNHAVEAFVSASAIGIYPNSLTTFYEENETAVDDSFLGEVVQAWEKEIDTFKAFDFKVSKIRIGLVLSDKGGALPKMAQPINNYVGAAFGSGQQWQSWIHNEDLARMFLFVLEKGLEGTFNGVAPNPVINTKLTKELAKVLKKPLLLPNVPKVMMELLLGEMAYLLFTSQRVSSKRIEKKGFVFDYKNICKALESFYGGEACEEKTMEPTYERNYS
ncbi:MAG: TIGR01777 family oxidoreductase [Bacteroidota bacterium]